MPLPHDDLQAHLDLVYGTCLRVLGNAQDAADVTQDVAMIWLRDRATIRTSTAAWLHAVAHCKAVNMVHRRDAQRRALKASGRSATVEGAVDLNLDGGLRGQLDAALADLPTEPRGLLLEHHLEGRDLGVMAQRRKTSRATISRRLAQARDLLATALARRGIAVGGAVLASMLATEAQAASCPSAIVGAMAAKMPAAGLSGGLAASGTMGAGAAKIALVAALLVGGALAWRFLAPDPPLPEPRPARMAESAFHVSPGGRDDGDGSLARPFRTLVRARAAMRGSLIKTTYLLDGVYRLEPDPTLEDDPNRARYAIGLNLDQHDSGESWLAHPGATPVLDGGGTIRNGIFIGFYQSRTNRITIRGITFQRMENGIQATSASQVLIADNVFRDLSSPDTSNAGINVSSGTTDALVSRNRIERNRGPGIRVADDGSVEPAGVRIEGNDILDTNAGLDNSSAIRVWGSRRFLTGIVISGNRIRNYGGNRRFDLSGICLAQTSGALVTGNIVSGTGGHPLMIHGGDHNRVENNVFDISEPGRLAVYQDSQGLGSGNLGMAGNVFARNIVYSAKQANTLWDGFDQSVDPPGIALPSIAGNLYFVAQGDLPTPGPALVNTTASPPVSDGVFGDASPQVGDPRFADPTHGDYAVRAGSAASLIGFEPIDQRRIGPPDRIDTEGADLRVPSSTAHEPPRTSP